MAYVAEHTHCVLRSEQGHIHSDVRGDVNVMLRKEPPMSMARASFPCFRSDGELHAALLASRGLIVAAAQLDAAEYTEHTS